MLTCLICQKEYKHLGSHIYHAHGLFAYDYKKKFSLDIKHGLVTDEIKLKQKENVDKYKTYLKNFKGSYKFRFKKGHIRPYFSAETKERCKNQSANLLKAPPKPCPVCSIRFNNVHIHLIKKHGLRYSK